MELDRNRAAIQRSADTVERFAPDLDEDASPAHHIRAAGYSSQLKILRGRNAGHAKQHPDHLAHLPILGRTLSVRNTWGRLTEISRSSMRSPTSAHRNSSIAFTE